MTVTQIVSLFDISKQTLYNWTDGKYTISNDDNKRVYVRTYLLIQLIRNR